ncbi:MAG: RNA 3'-terminal phosphate cyclase [Thermodesulfobacteriota bacterium]
MSVIEIDGSSHSGSGTILRVCVALATLLRRPLHVRNIRAARPKPGLRAQHLTAVQACCQLTGGELSGGHIGSTEIYYHPGRAPIEGDFALDVGTAGSATMLAYTLFVPALFGSGPCRFRLTGGIFQDFAPSGYHMLHCLVPLLRRMNAKLELRIRKPGYVPKGQGLLDLNVVPLSAGLKPLQLVRQGDVLVLKGISLASHLREQQVARRMSERCWATLARRGLGADLHLVEDDEAVQKGAALALWAETSSGALLGSDMAGRPGRRSETIADVVTKNLLEDLGSGATVDRHMADQLILFGALAAGTTEYLIPRSTEHVESNRWVIRKILGAESRLERNRLVIEGVGFSRRARGHASQC